MAISEVIVSGDIGPWFAGALAELYATMAAQGFTASGPAGGMYASALFSQARGEATLFVPCSGSVRAVGRVVPITSLPLSLQRLFTRAHTPTSTLPTAHWPLTWRGTPWQSKTRCVNTTWWAHTIRPTKARGVLSSAGLSFRQRKSHAQLRGGAAPSSVAGRRGRTATLSPHAGHTPASIVVAQCEQKVHSSEQMRASCGQACRLESQHSHLSLNE
jgi:hypothetical protein